MTKKLNQPRKPSAVRTATIATADAHAPRSVESPAACDEQGSLARIHDLRSVAMLSLPQGLRALIGDETFEAMVARLESLELQMVLRPEGKVVFLAMPLVTFDQDKLGSPPDAEVSRDSAAAAANAATPAAPSSSAAAPAQTVPQKARKPRSAS
ncbi:MAG: hypothetical protein Q7K57_26865 [Burkholderiaceae bacterium]|nr:hypothetical protein [Burkholderiaceae bacterium]